MSERDSYYGRPVIKPVEWTRLIPTYFFTGGLAAGASLLALAGRLRRHETAAGRMTFAALGAVGVSTYCLIFDLGRPRRFHHMLRVFKPTSPMSVGTYVLTAFGGAETLAAAGRLLGLPAAVTTAGEALAGGLAPLLATYTAVLIGDTAVPAWHEGRTAMPFVFAATSATSAGALGMLVLPTAEAVTSRRLALGGAVAELIAVRGLRREVGPLVEEAYTSGKAAPLMHFAEALTTIGALGTIAARRSRIVAAIAGAALFAGAVCERFGVFEAGRTAAAEPRFTVELQRSRAAQRAGERSAPPPADEASPTDEQRNEAPVPAYSAS